MNAPKKDRNHKIFSSLLEKKDEEDNEEKRGQFRNWFCLCIFSENRHIIRESIE